MRRVLGDEHYAPAFALACGKEWSDGEVVHRCVRERGHGGVHRCECHRVARNRRDEATFVGVWIGILIVGAAFVTGAVIWIRLAAVFAQRFLG